MDAAVRAGTAGCAAASRGATAARTAADIKYTTHEDLTMKHASVESLATMTTGSGHAYAAIQVRFSGSYYRQGQQRAVNNDKTGQG